MTDRLSALDASFLYLEGPTTPMHVGGLAVFAAPEEGFDHDRLIELIKGRIGLVPRYRKKIRMMPGHLANPVWIDDTTFDINFHVRRSALPKPGNEEQLKDLVGRLMSRPLDRNRPLWEIYLVEGLADGRVAIITKTHHALVDGVSGMEIGQVILDLTPEPRETAIDLWMPEPEPSLMSLIVGSLTDYARHPTAIIDTVRTTVTDFRATAGRLAGAVSGIAATAKVVARPTQGSPLNADITGQRRFGVARTQLDDYKRVRKAHGGTINDVVLATVTGALRNWLLARGEPVTAATSVRAMVPVSVRTAEQAGTGGNQVSAFFVDLPVGEPNPTLRLTQISYAMKAHKEAGQSVGANTLVTLAGFAPPTLHSLGARVANGMTSRIFNLVVTNVPGPQFPLYAGGAQMLEVFPVVPLAKGQAVCIGLTSYNGGVYYGLNADRDAMGDVDVLASLIEESLAELIDTVT